jgi:hypothetical protein
MAAFGPCLKVIDFPLPSGRMAVGMADHRRYSVTGVPRFWRMRIQPGRGGLGLCRCGVLGSRNGNGPSTERPVFRPLICSLCGIGMAWWSRYDGQPYPFVRVLTPPMMPALGAALIADFWHCHPLIGRFRRCAAIYAVASLISGS